MTAILLDIEGTVAPVDFVHQVLLPYAKAKMGRFVASHRADLDSEIELLEKEYHRDFANQIYGRSFRSDDPATVAAYLEFLIDVDRRSSPLKSIQAMIWQAGYESGDLNSVVFDDVPTALGRWKTDGKSVAVFSSGSVLAQKLIFRYSNFGDLTGSIDAWFDTATGSKTEARSFSAIADALGAEAAAVTYISDAPPELAAAKKAGFRTVLSVRPGNGLVRAPIAFDAAGSLLDI